ncbi:DUF3459 domain-containing protein [Streptomyces phaeochromogenes]|uniref:DUF3459 domain-containing protein n=1 Tax=Streptomyces phaeochromogenes TaxID=1923 RepID=UPI002E12DA9B|nr:DUF3459 domain-containing protein [Streptomyces phaeochromogenes]
MTGSNLAGLIAQMRERQPQLVDLAAHVSLTVSVDRAFLRKARLRFLPRTTAGLEADLWFSPLVDAAGSQVLILDPEAAELLRENLAQHSPALLQEVRDFTVEEHASAPLVVRLYEELLWSGFSSVEAADRHVTRHAARVLETVSGEGVPPVVADDMGRWALHYASRLPTHLLSRDDVWRIQVASCERLGLELPEDPAERPTTVTTQARARVQHDMAVGVEAQSDGIVLSRPPTSGARILHARGTMHKVRIDAQSSLAHRVEPIRLDLLDGQSMHLPFTVVQRISPEGDLLMSLSHPGTALAIAVADYTGTSRDAAHCAVLLSDGSIVLHGGDGSESGRIPEQGARTTRSGMELSPDGTEVSYVQNGIRQYHPLRPSTGTERWRDDRAEPLPDGPPTALQATARDVDVVVRATADGRILATSATLPGRPTTLDIGQAPWEVTSLAVSADGRWAAAVGNDSLLLELPIVPGGRPRETRVHFCANQIFAVGDGGWVIAGSGGPVELSTEDGRGYRVMPDIEPPTDADGLPTWSRCCVLAETPIAQMDAVASIPGVDCLVVQLIRVTAQEQTEFTHRLAAAHRHGVRVVVGIDLASSQADAVDAVRTWLEQDVDGLLLSGTVGTPAVVLDDVRHLLDGYDDRLLVGTSALPADRRSAFHVVPASALLSTLGFAMRSRGVGGGASEQAMSQLRYEIGDTFSASPREVQRGTSFQWALDLPPALPQALRMLAASILLALPGCPVLPGSMLLEVVADGLPLRSLLELRRNHLALSRGDCRVLDAGPSQVLAVARGHGDDQVLCLVNVGHIQTTAEFGPGQLGPTARLQDLLGGSVITVPDRSPLTLPMAAGSVRWFRRLAQ